MFDAAAATTLFSAFGGSVATILQENLGTILGIAAALIGLGILIRYFLREVAMPDVQMFDTARADRLIDSYRTWNRREVTGYRDY